MHHSQRAHPGGTALFLIMTLTLIPDIGLNR